MDYPVNDAVMDACRHAATIARLRFQGLDRGLVPTADSETATVTFIKIKGRTYAVTARHVIETLDNLARRDGNQFEGYSCVQSPGVAIVGPFLTPPADYPNPQPDIAICPVHESLPGRIKKAPFEIGPQSDAKWPVSHAVAVGFPTVEKHDTQDELGGIRLALPCVHALAEGLNSSGSSDQVQFHSEISERPSVVSLSGMSGGPVFWSDGPNHGLIGFVKEALDVTPKEGEETFYTEPKVNFICQRVDFAILERWTQYVDTNWQKERDKINAVIEKAPRSEG
jgi:hypothetical protein